STNYRTYPMSLVHLAADDPETARREMREAIKEWSQRGYHLQHLHVLLGLVRVELYAGDPSAAWRLIETEWPLFYGSLLSRIQEFRIQVLQAGAASALASAAGSPEMHTGLRVAKRLAGRLLREKMPAADATARYVQAALAFYKGHRADGIMFLREAAEIF